MPNQTTGGDGAFTGQEVHFLIDFTSPLNLPPDHYFFGPQVELTGSDGSFLWLSAMFLLVAKRDRIQREDCFTFVFHSLDVFFVAGRRLESAKLTLALTNTLVPLATV